MRRDEFFNENGNKIQMEVSVTEGCDVRILLRGPHSDSETLITLEEARRLHIALGEILRPPEPPPGRCRSFLCARDTISENNSNCEKLQPDPVREEQP